METVLKRGNWLWSIPGRTYWTEKDTYGNIIDELRTGTNWTGTSQRLRSKVSLTVTEDVSFPTSVTFGVRLHSGSNHGVSTLRLYLTTNGNVAPNKVMNDNISGPGEGLYWSNSVRRYIESYAYSDPACTKRINNAVSGGKFIYFKFDLSSLSLSLKAGDILWVYAIAIYSSSAPIGFVRGEPVTDVTLTYQDTHSLTIDGRGCTFNGTIGTTEIRGESTIQGEYAPDTYVNLRVDAPSRNDLSLITCTSRTIVCDIDDYDNSIGTIKGTLTENTDIVCYPQSKRVTLSFDPNGVSSFPQLPTSSHAVGTEAIVIMFPSVGAEYLNEDTFEIKYLSTRGTFENGASEKTQIAKISTPHIFKGWSTVKGNTVEYEPGDSIRLEEDTVLYAIWEKGTPVYSDNTVQDLVLVPPDPEISTIDVYMAWYINPDSETVYDYSNGTLIKSTPTNFVGWSLENGTPVPVESVLHESSTLIAVWTEGDAENVRDETLRSSNPNLSTQSVLVKYELISGEVVNSVAPSSWKSAKSLTYNMLYDDIVANNLSLSDISSITVCVMQDKMMSVNVYQVSLEGDEELIDTFNIAVGTVIDGAVLIECDENKLKGVNVPREGFEFDPSSLEIDIDGNKVTDNNVSAYPFLSTRCDYVDRMYPELVDPYPSKRGESVSKIRAYISLDKPVWYGNSTQDNTFTIEDNEDGVVKVYLSYIRVGRYLPEVKFDYKWFQYASTLFLETKSFQVYDADGTYYMVKPGYILKNFNVGLSELSRGVEVYCKTITPPANPNFYYKPDDGDEQTNQFLLYAPFGENNDGVDPRVYVKTAEGWRPAYSVYTLVELPDGSKKYLTNLTDDYEDSLPLLDYGELDDIVLA